MRRHALSGPNWQRLEQILDASRPDPKPKIGDREFINAVLYRTKTGIPWRDLPERFGPWKTVYNRFNRWSAAGLWEIMFAALSIELDDDGDAHDRVATADVDVMRLGEGSGGPYTAITPLRVRAPTVEKATTTAKSLCGSVGGEVVFLHSEPYQQRDLWTLVGSCSVSDQTISARATPALGS